MGRVIAAVSVAAAVALVIMLQTTAPSTIGPLGILVVFILMYLSVLGVLTFLLYRGSRLLAVLSKSAVRTRPLEPMPLHQAYYYSTVISLGPVMLVGMQSVGTVTFYEFLLVAVFISIGCTYIAKRTN